MHETDLNRVEFFSKDDLLGGYQIKKGEHILRAAIKSNQRHLRTLQYKKIH